MHGQQPSAAPVANGPRNVLRHDLPTGGEDHHALHEIAQLAHIAGPRILGQQLHGPRGDTVERPVVQTGKLGHEPTHQQRDVIRPLTQRRQIDAQHVEAIVQIGAEPALLHVLAQRAVGRRHHAHVNRDGLRSAHPRDFALLQHPQQLHLRAGGHLADLVQKERTRVRQLKSPQTSLSRAGECALLVSEQFALQQRLWERPHVHRNERLRTTRAQAMNGPRHELLARAALTFDEHRARHRRNLFDLHQHFADGLRLAHQPGQLRQSLAFKATAHAVDHLVDGHGLGPGFRVAEFAQPLGHGGIRHVGKAQHGDAVPQLLAHQRDVGGIEQRPSEHEHVRGRAAKIAAHVIHWRNRDGLVAKRLKGGIEPDSRLHVTHQDGDDSGRVVATPGTPRRRSARGHALAGLL